MNLQPEPPNITIDSSERVFDAPWEAHVFAITVRLHEQAQFDWTEWSRYLAEQIAQGSAESGPGNSASYYAAWLKALESVLLDKGLINDQELKSRLLDLQSVSGK